MTTDPLVEKYIKHIIPLTILLMLMIHINTKKLEQATWNVNAPATMDQSIHQ